MLVYCYKCFTPHRFDNAIPKGGKRLQCNECGYEYTLFPSKVIIGEFHDYVIFHTDLSGRALSTMLHNVSSVNQFFQLTRRDFLNFRNCGLKTADELVAFKKTLRKNLGYILNEKESKIQSDLTAIPFFLKDDSEFFETIMHELSPKSYDLFANKYQIDSLEKFMALKTENLISIKNCGYKTIREIRRIQNTIIDIFKIIVSRNNVKFNDFKSMIKLDRNIRDLLKIGEDIDPNEPYPSLNKWILSVSKNSQRNKKVFMQRMGLDGRQSQTYQQIALEHDISRERVRGIVEKLKKTGQLPVYKLRLDPLIERAKKIVRSRGRKMTISDLNTHLLCFGSQGELLKYATPFIEYINGFPSWQMAGLNIRDGFIYIESDLNA
jgi:hypothetical protein